MNFDECQNTDDNQCDTDRNRGGVCVDNDGSYTCECPVLQWSVLNEDGFNCENYDECDEPTHNVCDKVNSDCHDNAGGYTCECHVGWTDTTDDGATCNDVNECDGDHGCDANSVCVNTAGSYECHCNQGWFSDSVAFDTVCVNVNECASGSDGGNSNSGPTAAASCDANSECIDNDGSYFCVCNVGWYSASNSQASKIYNERFYKLNVQF